MKNNTKIVVRAIDKSHMKPDRRQSVLDNTIGRAVRFLANNQEREKLTLRHFNNLFGNGHIRVIRYEDIGADVHPYYPDWYKLTTAYKLEFSGMTAYEHVSSFFNPSDENNIKRRIIRWIGEEKIVTYCDRMDKLSIVASMIVMIITFGTAIWELMFQTADACNYGPREAQGYRIGRIIKVLLSSIPITVNLINSYKRTTVPKPNVLIRDFRRFTLVGSKQGRVFAHG